MAVQRFTSKDGTRVIVSVWPASGGLFSGVVPGFAPPDALASSNNLIHTIDGSRRTRPALIPYSSVPAFGAPVKWMFDFWRTIAGVKTQQILAIAGDTLWADAGDGNFQPVFSFPANEGAYAGDALVGLAVIGVKGLGLYTYNQLVAPTILDPANEPDGAWIPRKHRGSIYAIGSPESPEQLYKSATEDPTDWFVGGTTRQFKIDLGASDAKGLTALYPEIQGRLYMGKYNSLYELDTSVTTPILRPMSSTQGVLFHNTVVSVGPSDALFVSESGLHSLPTTAQYGDLAEAFISRAVNDIWKNRMDFSNPYGFSACYSKDYGCYLLSYPDKVVGGRSVLGYHVAQQQFFHWEDCDITFFMTGIKQPEFRQTVYCGMADGDVRQLAFSEDVSFLDAGRYGYASSFETPPIFPAAAPGPMFTFNQLAIYYRPRGSLPFTVTYQIDGNQPKSMTIAQGTVTTPGKMRKIEIPLSGLGTSITISVSTQAGAINTGAGQEIVGYNIYCLPAAEKWSNMELGA